MNNPVPPPVTPLGRRQKLRLILRKALASIAFFMVLYLILFGILFRDIVVTVPSGSVGVIWYRFFGGTEVHYTLREGLHLIFPWDKVYLYNIRPTRTNIEMPALTKEGLSVNLTVIVTMVANPKGAGYLHQAVGSDYISLIVEPVVMGVLRENIAAFRHDELYDINRRDFEPLMIQEVNTRLNALPLNKADDAVPLLQASNISLRSLALPAELLRAIEEKQAAQQAAMRYRFVLDRERLESERKEVEATGIKRFQEIVTPTISEAYLRWRGIDATLQLAQSPNSKIVVIGGQGGLPLILDTTSRAPLTLPEAPSPPPGPAIQSQGAESAAGNTPHDRIPIMPLPPTPSHAPTLP